MSKNKPQEGFSAPALFSDMFSPERFFGNDWPGKDFFTRMPAVNVKENGKEFKIEIAAPGFSKADFKISVENDVLKIAAEKKEEKTEKGEQYTRREFSSKSFTRAFTLPKAANGEKIDAKYENGILNLTLPKKPEALKSTPRSIKVG